MTITIAQTMAVLVLAVASAPVISATNNCYIVNQTSKAMRASIAYHRRDEVTRQADPTGFQARKINTGNNGTSTFPSTV
jgi:hypothetical protein